MTAILPTHLLDIEREMAETDTAPATGYEIGDRSEANWVLARVAEIEAEIAEAEAVARDQIERAQVWLEARKRTLGGRIVWWSMTLESFARREYAASGGKTKSVSLPHGVLRLRAPQARWTYDEPTLLEFLGKSGLNDLLRVTVAPDKAALKEATRITDTGEVVLAATGEVVPGVQVEREQQPGFNFKTAGGAE